VLLATATVSRITGNDVPWTNEMWRNNARAENANRKQSGVGRLRNCRPEGHSTEPPTKARDHGQGPCDREGERDNALVKTGSAERAENNRECENRVNAGRETGQLPRNERNRAGGPRGELPNPELTTTPERIDWITRGRCAGAQGEESTSPE